MTVISITVVDKNLWSKELHEKLCACLGVRLKTVREGVNCWNYIYEFNY